MLHSLGHVYLFVVIQLQGSFVLHARKYLHVMYCTIWLFCYFYMQFAILISTPFQKLPVLCGWQRNGPASIPSQKPPVLCERARLTRGGAASGFDTFLKIASALRESQIDQGWCRVKMVQARHLFKSHQCSEADGDGVWLWHLLKTRQCSARARLTRGGATSGFDTLKSLVLCERAARFS